ncbi:MAG: TonB-dependent receptor, partial [Leptospiraceae bacterium]|nr:TonB-dependent receptor [Leptospiraceae bacterium]
EYFLEGMPLPRPYNAPLNLETLPLPLFRSVEIYPSFIPAHLPATNIGGALDFRLRDCATGTCYLTQSYANSLIGSGMALARLSAQSLHFANFEQSRNRYFFRSNSGTPENTADDKVLMRENEDFTRVGYTGFVRHKTGSWNFRGLLDLNYSERGLPGVENQPLSAVRKRDERYALAFSAEQSLTAAHKLIYFNSAVLDRSAIEDPKTELFFSRGQKSHSPQLLAGLTYAWRSTDFEVGLHTRGKYQNIVFNGAEIASRREAQGAMIAAYDKNLLRLALQANATAGEDSAAANAFFASAAKNFVQQGAGASGLFALRPLFLWRKPGDALHDKATLELYAQASSVYRPPTLYERFGDNVFVTPSEKLRSEQAITNAAGIRTAFPCAFNMSCSLRSEVWLTGARNYIIFTQNSARTLIAVNASSAQIFGVENEILLNVPERFLLSLRYTYLQAEDYGNIPYYQGKFLPLRPRHHAVGVLTIFAGTFRFIGSIEYRGAIFRDRYNSYFYYLESKTLLDLGVDFIFIRGARHMLNLTVKNVLDDQRPDILGYPLPGRYLLAKWTAEW